MTLRERLRARQLPTAVVEIAAAVKGAEPERVELRALTPVDWEALVALHPPTPEQREMGAAWDPATFRPALLARCVVTPPGEEDQALSEQDWVEAAECGWLTAGELLHLFDRAVELNDRAPFAAAGKG